MKSTYTLATVALLGLLAVGCKKEKPGGIPKVPIYGIRIGFADSAGADVVGVGKRYGFAGWAASSAPTYKDWTPFDLTNGQFNGYYAMRHDYYYYGGNPGEENINDSFHIRYPDFRIDTLWLIRTQADSGILYRNGALYARINVHDSTTQLVKLVQPD